LCDLRAGDIGDKAQMVDPLPFRGAVFVPSARRAVAAWFRYGPGRRRADESLQSTLRQTRVVMEVIERKRDFRRVPEDQPDVRWHRALYACEKR
jgi:hypothetical protein